MVSHERSARFGSFMTIGGRMQTLGTKCPQSQFMRQSPRSLIMSSVVGMPHRGGRNSNRVDLIKGVVEHRRHLSLLTTCVQVCEYIYIQLYGYRQYFRKVPHTRTPGHTHRSFSMSWPSQYQQLHLDENNTLVSDNTPITSVYNQAALQLIERSSGQDPQADLSCIDPSILQGSYPRDHNDQGESLITP
jgi:hypothetical protein